ncbi:MAG TPA: PAS domain S-box protein, partial [Gemmataceae bacterium]|nr:PAS domain S-box protein [Gemmataceae bacterium]
DVVMPEMDGFEAATLIRQRPRTQYTPIIFLTAYSTSDIDKMRGYELGAVDYVFAPIIPEILRAKVSVFVELYRNRRELAQAHEQLLAEISEREFVERQARAMEERFRLMVENVFDYAIIMLDPQGNVATWNIGGERVLGYRAEEVIGQQFSRFLLPEDLESNKPQKEMETAARVGRYEEENWRVRKDGTRFWANVIITALHDSEGNLVGFAKIMRDLTERKRIEEKAMQAERLAVIGQMVAGLAHESRNSLQQIQAAIEMLTRRLKPGLETELVSEIQKANDRLHHLLENIRGYAAPMKLNYAVHDLAAIWDEAWSQLHPMRKGREVDFAVEKGNIDLHCQVDPFTMEQLFRNILQNALEAVGGKGRIEVRCAEADLNGRPAVRVAFKDSGPGLNEEQKRRIFDPFFTTKSRGTGLGMAIAKRIVDAHGGMIGVANGTLKGTEIEVVLPRGQT